MDPSLTKTGLQKFAVAETAHLKSRTFAKMNKILQTMEKQLGPQFPTVSTSK